jgi:hypothetical protein
MRIRFALIAMCLGLVAPGAALGAGGPVAPAQGEGNGISVPGSPYQYVALGAGHSTVVQELSRTGPVRSSIRLRGSYGIPGVGYNGSTTGLSADDGTLVLAGMFGNNAPRTTRLIVLGAPHLTVLARIALRGWFTVDAISPTGHFLYLIHYPSSNNITDYEVRAYDLAHHRLLATPIVDPHDRGEAMTGFAVTRATSADGRWDYTLYIRPNDVPFIHALDTVALRAVCVDLPSVNQADLGNATLHLGPGGSVLSIQARGRTEATVDTATYVVTPGAKPLAVTLTPRPPSHGSQPTGDGSSSVPWAVIALLLVAGGAFAVAAFGARRRARARVT